MITNQVTKIIIMKRIKIIIILVITTLFFSMCQKEKHNNKIDIINIASSVPDELFMMYGNRPLERLNSDFMKNLGGLGKSVNDKFGFNDLSKLYNKPKNDLYLISFTLIPFDMTLVAYPAEIDTISMMTYFKNHHSDKSYWKGYTSNEKDSIRIFTSNNDSTGLKKSFLKRNNAYLYGNENAINKNISINQNEAKKLSDNPLFIESLELIDLEASEFLISFGKYADYFKSDVVKTMNPNVADSLLAASNWNSLLAGGKSEYWSDSSYKLVWKFKFSNIKIAKDITANLEASLSEILHKNYNWFFYDFFGPNTDNVDGVDGLAQFCEVTRMDNMVSVEFEFTFDMILPIIEASW
mgnify:CR=1 FL=1